MLRPCREADRPFLFDLHRAALGEYVTATWGWDEQVQRAMFDAAFVAEGQQIVVLGGTDIGMLRVINAGDYLEVGLMELLPLYQRRGIGTKLLLQVLDEADHQAMPVRLQVMRVKPGALALRAPGICGGR